jgi:hypothetical protein
LYYSWTEAASKEFLTFAAKSWFKRYLLFGLI